MYEQMKLPAQVCFVDIVRAWLEGQEKNSVEFSL